MSDKICQTLVKLPAMKKPSMTRKVEFQNCFYHSMTDEAFELLTNLTTKRDAVLTACRYGSSVSINEQLAAVDVYLGDLWRLFQSLNGQSPVTLDRSLRFDWSTYLYTNRKEKNATSAGISFEVMMTLHLKASLHYHAAASLIEADFRDVSEAAKHLSTAAGLISYVEVSGTITEGTSGAIVPNEMKAPYCALLRKYYHGCAQQMFASKAIQSNNSLAAKVSLAVSDMMRDALLFVPSSGLEEWFVHMGFLREFFYAVAFKLRAEALSAKSETGDAIACANFAAGRLATQPLKPYNPMQPGIPKLKNIEEPYASGFSELLNQISAACSAATKDNNTVYFLSVPDSISGLAEPLVGMVAVPLPTFSPPPFGKIVEFKYDPNRRPSTLAKIGKSWMSAISASFGLGETTEKAEAADPKESTAESNAATASAGSSFDPSSIVSSAATPTTVLSFLPPTEGSSSSQDTTAVGGASPATSLKRSDSDLARELDRQLNGTGSG